MSDTDIAREMAYTTWPDSCKAPHPDKEYLCRRPRTHNKETHTQHAAHQGAAVVKWKSEDSHAD